MHGAFPLLEGGDLLIITGDITQNDTPEQWSVFYQWLDNQNYEKKIFIAGNHDNLLNKEVFHENYLCNSGTEFHGLNIWGTPHSLNFLGINPHCKAFTGYEIELEQHYMKIPDDTDILVSHTPFHGILDQNYRSYHCGSRTLRQEVERVNPSLFICSHIHEQGEKKTIYSYSRGETLCVNASIMDENYYPSHKPVRISL